MIAPNRGVAAARDTNRDEENDHQHRGGADCCVREEMNEDMFQVHAEKYGTPGGLRRSYENART